MKRGSLFALFGLLLGLASGLIVVAGKNYIAKELIKILEDEVRNSCDCSLAYDSVDLSLITLRAVARNVRMLERGELRLHFPRVEADFSLAQIRERKINLTDLRLIGGHSIGVGPRTATFRFIDYLTLPIPPERDTPDRWRVQLLKLQVRDSSFEERIKTHVLKARGVNLLMTRNKEDNFDLLPTIASLEVFGPQDPVPFHVGDLAGQLTITDEWVTAHSISIMRGDSSAQLQGRIRQKDTLIEGSHTLVLGPRILDYASITSPHTVEVTGSITGTLSHAFATGTLSNPHGSKLNASILDIPLGTVRDVQATLEGELSSDIARITVSQGQVRGETFDFLLDGPLLISHEAQQGKAILSLTLHPMWNMLLSTPRAALELRGDAEDSQISGEGTLSADTEGLTSIASEVSFSMLHKNEDISLTLNSNSESRFITLPFKGAINSTFRVNPEQPVTTNVEGEITLVEEGSFFPLTLRPVFSGPLDNIAQLEGTIEITSPLVNPLGMKGLATLSGGAALLSASNHSSTLYINGTLPFSRPEDSTLELKASKLNFIGKMSAQDTPCSEISAISSYRFPFFDPIRGSGSLSLSSLSLGCSPHVVSLVNPREITVKEGALSIADLELKGFDTSFRFNGLLNVNGNYEISSSGDLDLSFIRAALSELEDIRGKVRYALRAYGAPSNPKWEGHLSIEDAGLELTSPTISLRSFNAHLQFDGDHFNLQDASGIVNEGTLSMEGALYPFAFERSRLAVELQNVFAEPVPNATIELSSSLLLEPTSTGEGSLRGEITILSGEFNTETSIPSMLRSFLRDAVRAPRLPLARAAQAAAWDAPIFLDIKVHAPGDLIILTNWMGAELKADLHIEGLISDPKPIGTVEFITGWLGLRDKRFEVSSGKLTYTTNASEPELEILAESTFRSRQGDTILVFLEVGGSLANPKISLTSDRGLTEREILALLTDTGSVVSQRRIETIGGGVQIDTLEFLEDRSYLGLGRLVRDLARIDSITLEPTFNSRTGVVEPSVVATKRLFDRLVLQAQSPLTTTGTEATLRARFEMTPQLDVLASAETDNESNNTALGLDVSYIISGFEDKRLFPRVSGNRAFSSIQIVREAKISEISRLRQEDLSTIEERVTKFYRDEGFFLASTRVSCEMSSSQTKDICRLLRIDIDEGEPALVESIQLSEALPPEVARAERFVALSEGTLASRQFRKNLEREIISALRREGFIAARANSSYKETDDPLKRLLLIELYSGQPITFIFQGNTRFSSEELLQTINLFGRKQPFGANTTSVLLQNIERKYAEAGYLYATVRVDSALNENTGRKIVTLQIDEGPRTPVADVKFSGLHQVKLGDLKKGVTELLPTAREELFNPSVAIPDIIERNEGYIREYYAARGYTYASVSSGIIPDEEQGKVEIHYYIQEGPQFLVRSLEMTPVPEVKGLPTQPVLPISLDEINQYLENLSQVLADRGYLRHEITTSYEVSTGSLVLSIIPGALTTISSIEITGMEGLDIEEIRPSILVSEGSNWDQELLSESRRRLLQLALFSSVELGPADGKLDAGPEKLLVKVTQRSLQALSLGTGVNSEYGLHFFGEAVDRSYFADGRSISARLDVYYDRAQTEVSQGIGSIAFANPALFNSNYGYVSDLRYQKLDLETQEFDLDRVGFSNFLHRSWEEGFSFSFGHNLLFDNLDNVSPDVILSSLDRGNVQLSLLSGVLTYDKRNDRLNPERGYNLSVDYLLTSNALGSDANFAGGTGKFSFLYPLPWLSPQFSFASGSRLGALWVFSDTDFVPITQRYYIGGRTSVRGFRENSLGPRGDEGGVIGGDLMFVENLELRYRMFDALSMHVFLDAGALYLQEVSISADDIRFSSGVGLRYLSPIGPIGFDLGIPLDEQPGEPSFRLHFSIGSNF